MLTETQHVADTIYIKIYEQEDFGIHQHNFFELVYITGGSTNHILNGVENQLSAGNYFIVDYGSVHAYEMSHNLQLINCLFLPTIIDDTLDEQCTFQSLIQSCLLRYYKIYDGKSPANRVFYDDDGHILQLMMMNLQEYTNKKVGYKEIIKNNILEVIIVTMRSIIEEDISKTNDDLVIALIQFIHKNYMKEKVLTGFCEKYHYTPQYVSRKFKIEMGVSPNRFTQKVRIEKSCELLAGSRLSLYQVAESVGYTDMKFFSMVFKKFMDTTPGQYRKNWKNNFS